MSYYGQDVHDSKCEDNEFFFCKVCTQLVHESATNICPVCMLFIPRMWDCICDLLEGPEEPDWDEIRKEEIIERLRLRGYGHEYSTERESSEREVQILPAGG